MTAVVADQRKDEKKGSDPFYRARLLRDHIQKEDRVLYPMAKQMLPESAWQQIESEFSAFQAAPRRAEQAARLERVAGEFAGRYAADDEAPQ